MDINEDLILHKRMKESCFRFLAGFFYFPQKSLIEEAKLLENLSEYLKVICEDSIPFISAMEKNFHQFSDQELQVEYAKLFKGPFELIAPPYGSVYLDDGRRVMGDSTMEVIQTYEQEGVARSNDFKDLPDHIVVELEFMSFLIYQELDALQNSDLDKAKEYLEKQENFMNNFLRQWVVPFCEKIKGGTVNPFYASLADCLSTFIMSPKLISEN